MLIIVSLLFMLFCANTKHIVQKVYIQMREKRNLKSRDWFFMQYLLIPSFI